MERDAIIVLPIGFLPPLHFVNSCSCSPLRYYSVSFLQSRAAANSTLLFGNRKYFLSSIRAYPLFVLFALCCSLNLNHSVWCPQFWNFLFFFFLIFWLHCTACRDLPQPGIEPMPPQQKPGILTSRPPGKSRTFWLKLVLHISITYHFFPEYVYWWLPNTIHFKWVKCHYTAFSW